MKPIKIQVVRGPLDILDDRAADLSADLQKAWIDGYEFVVGQERIQPLLHSAVSVIGQLRAALSDARAALAAESEKQT